MKKGILLCVDLSNQVYKASAVNATLRSEGRFTGGLYGFLTAMSKAILHTGATDIVLCQDRKPYLRSEIYPEYKSLRQGTKDEDLVLRVNESMQYISQLASVLGLPIWAIQGFESDDLVAHATTKYRHFFDRIIAASNDSDLFQLFKYPNFAVWKGKGGLYSHKDFEKEWAMPPEDYITALAITGTHNEIAGIVGVGPVGARAAISKPEKLRALRAQHAATIDRNVKLIQLPHPEFPRDAQLPRKTHKFNERELMNFCGRYDIDMTRAMADAFAQLHTRDSNERRATPVRSTTRKHSDSTVLRRPLRQTNTP